MIPACIIGTRLVKYAWKIYQAKKYGYDDDLFEDPLAELGLRIRRGYENTVDIRKIRKEQRHIKSEIQQRAKVNEMTIQEAEGHTINDIREKLIKNFPQIQVAEGYLSNIRRQTRRTWADRLSPDAVRRWISVSRYARAWMVFQVFCTLLAIMNYVMLTYLVHQEDRNERKLIKNMDLFYAAIFLVDYSLSFYIAEDRLRFYINYLSLIDLLSIVSPFVFVLVSSDTKFVWFVGLIRIFRATRILRTYRILAFSQSEETRELTAFILNFANFVFFSASVINATETLVVNFNGPPSLLNWHDSLYYIMVTFSTIGFGDLTPTSSISRIIVMFLIILVIVYVPYQTGKILELYNSLSRYQRVSHQASSNHPHVILSGGITASSLVDFCREYFIADQLGTIVILNTQEPNIEIRRLLSHPFYRNRLIYLRGDLMSVHDLKRAAAQYATALFLLNTQSPDKLGAKVPNDQAEESNHAQSMDAQVLMQSLISKSAFPGLPIFAQVQDIQFKDLSEHCGCDRILCIDEIKMSLVATNCIVPGIQTLVLNLIHSYKELENSTLSDFWMQEYQYGVANQIYTFKVPAGLVKMKFHDAAREVYMAYGTIIFGLISSNAGFNKNRVRMRISRDYRIKNDDIAFCISDGGDETILRICLYFKEAYKRTQLDQRDLELEMENVIDKHTKIPEFSSIHSGNSSPLSDFSGFEEIPRESIPLGSMPADLSGHILLCGHMTARAVRQFVTSICSDSDSVPSPAGSAFLKSPKTPTPAKSGIASKKKIPRVPIVCLAETLPKMDDLGIWAEILSYPNVYIVHGASLKKASLVQAGIDRCLRIVVLAESNGSNASSNSIPDSQALFIVKMIQREWPHVRFLVELIDGSNVKYFSARTVEWDTNNLRMQSILSNYALSLGDRLDIYKKVRAEHAEQSSIWFQLIQFISGPAVGGMARTQSTPRTESRISSEHKKGNNGKEYLPVRSDKDRLTPKHAVKQAKAQGDFEELAALVDDENRVCDAPLISDASDTNNKWPGRQGESSGDDEIIPESEDRHHQVPITEAYLQKLLEEAELNESGLSPYPVYHFDRHFAAGMVATSSFMHSLLCQSYFRPYIVDVVRELIANIVHLPVSDSCAGKKYTEVVDYCLSAGYVPIGLYRRGAVAGNTSTQTPLSPNHPRQAASSQASDVENMPYVYTNCRSDDIVQATDLVFAIRQ
ncbi:hypothetical protein BASA50_009144 [Batrachochytrium salamandrivorans]|uniref:Uncharacterized protein n=1 Tax=Batrachochytrium salamandrivorans TaxID=1357716 RepID=A0ABQ8F2X3_9FUNG|nr:hypothetical protein BASA50_009144 [Batrachochytrium salamandrivorans]KAH9268663.1 hypothetical protein BASA84_000091 [Batrachochytrium salamandrivorans]